MSIDAISSLSSSDTEETKSIDSTQAEREKLALEENLLLWLKSFLQTKAAEVKLPPGPAGISGIEPKGISFDLAEDQQRLDQIREILPQALTPGSYIVTPSQLPSLKSAIDAKLTQIGQALNSQGSQFFKDVEPLEPLLIKLNDILYEKHGKEIDKHVKAINALNDDMEKLVKFTQLIQRKKTEQAAPDSKNDGTLLFTAVEEKEIVDYARPLIPQALKENSYTLTKDQSEALLHSIDLKIKELSNKITPHTSYMTEAFDARKSDVEKFYKLLERYERLKSDIIRNFKS